LWALIPLFELVRGILDWLNERYIITSRRVIRLGAFSTTVRISTGKGQRRELKQSWSGDCSSTDRGDYHRLDVGVNVSIRISNPVKFKRAMLNAKELLHTRAVDVTSRSAGACPPGSGAGFGAGRG